MKTSDQIIARIGEIAAQQRAAEKIYIEDGAEASARECHKAACVLETLSRWAQEPVEEGLQECRGCGDLGEPNTKDGDYYCGGSERCIP